MLCTIRFSRLLVTLTPVVCLLAAVVAAQTSRTSSGVRLEHLRLIEQEESGPYHDASGFPVDAVGLNNLAVSLANAGDLEKALETSRRAVSLDMGSAAARVNLALIYDWNGDMDNAYREARAAVQLDRWNARARSYFCELELVLQRWEEAVGCYREVVEDLPPNLDIQVRFAIAMIKTDQLGEARTFMEKVHSEHPADFHVINTLASVYYHAGDFRKSIELLKPAVEQNPDEGRLRLNLGMSYLAMGNRAAALSQYNLIKDSSPDAAELLYRQLSAKYVVTARP